MLTVYEVINKQGIIKVFRTRSAAESFQVKLVDQATKIERLQPVAWIRESKYSNSIR